MVRCAWIESFWRSNIDLGRQVGLRYNLVSHAGVVPVLELTERAGLSELIAEAVTLPAASVPAKARAVIGGMLAGADSIDDPGLTTVSCWRSAPL